MNFPDKIPDMVRLPPNKKWSFIKMCLLFLAAFSGFMLLMAVPNLITGDGILAWAKALVLSASATVVAYGINRLAIEKGAPLAVVGYIGAGIASIVSIAVVGIGLFMATFAGLAYDDVAKLQLQEHGTNQTHFVGNRSSSASAAGRVIPVAGAIALDLTQKLDCEIRTSCVSGRGQGGHGPVAREMEAKAGRAASITLQLATAEKARKESLVRLNTLLADYHAVLGDTDKTIRQQRQKLQIIDAEIQQASAVLDEAIPVSLLSAYARELQSGAVIPNRPEASARLNQVLQKHGIALQSVLSTIDQGDKTAPRFPKRTGVSDTFDFLGHFAPLAVITAVVELIFPLVLWLYTFFGLSWANYRIVPPGPRPPSDDDLDGLNGFSILRKDAGNHSTPSVPPKRPRGRKPLNGQDRTPE